MFSPLEQFDAIIIKSIVVRDSDYTIFSVLIPFILLILLTYMILCISTNFTLVPIFIQWVCELNLEFVFDLIKQQIGRGGYIYCPIVFTLFNFILINNLFSLLPFGIALTSHLILILWLSLSLSLSISVIGIYYHNIRFLKIFIPESPLLLLPMLICIEIFSYIIKSFSLAIRLSANIMAGHTLVFIISSFLLKVTKIKIWFFSIGFIFLLFILFLELGVAFLQAYVFSVLVCIYLNDSLKGSSH